MKYSRLLFPVILLSLLAACGLKRNLELPKEMTGRQAHKEDGVVNGSEKNFSFSVKNGEQYALADSGDVVYTLIEGAGSPPISSLLLPPDKSDASQYGFSYLTGTTWSALQTAKHGATIKIPDAKGLSVVLLDANGARLTKPADMTFYLGFSAGGDFTGTIKGIESDTR